MTSHLSPEEFRQQGYAVIDWISRYQSEVEKYPVRSRALPGEVAASLPLSVPPGGEGIEALLADLDTAVMPGITHWQHPDFYAYFPANASGPAILGDLIASGLGVQGMVWATSPAATEVETRVMDWLAEILDLPSRFRSTGPGGGVIQDTASTAVLTALVAALHRASGGAIRRNGFDRRYTVYCSEEAHSSVAKAVTVAGVGAANLRKIPTEYPGGPMDVRALGIAVAADLTAGAVPALIVSAVGTTGTGAVDNTAVIAAVAQECGAWLHVDAAWAGVAAAAPEFRDRLNHGLGYADSYATNPHKWLLTNFDCDAFYVADRRTLTDALAENPEYLRTAESDAGAVIDYRDWHIQLGRRFRALKLWAVMRHYGQAGLAEHIRSGVQLASSLATLLRADSRFVVTHQSLSLVCFSLAGESADRETSDGKSDGKSEGKSEGKSDGKSRNGDTSARTLALMQRINDGGSAYLSHTVVGGQAVIRVAIGAPTTTMAHIQRLYATMVAAIDA